MKFVHSRREPPKIGVRGPIGRTAPIVTQLAMQLAAGDGAPVCPITRGEVPPAQPGIKVPTVPRANDLQSAIDAINKIIDILSTDSTPSIRWLEKWRTTMIVTITNPNDDSQWVDVERIQELMMEDQITGDLWYWQLSPPQPPAPTTAPGPLITAQQFKDNPWLANLVVRPT